MLKCIYDNISTLYVQVNKQATRELHGLVCCFEYYVNQCVALLKHNNCNVSYVKTIG